MLTWCQQHAAAQHSRRAAIRRRPERFIPRYVDGSVGRTTGTPDSTRHQVRDGRAESAKSLSAPLHIAEGTCTAARSAALAKFCVGRSWCECNPARGCKLAHRRRRLPEQLDRAESIERGAQPSIVSRWIELVMTQSVTADRHFFSNQHPASLHLPPNAPQYAVFNRINPQRSCRKRPPIRHIPDPQVN